MQRGKIFKFLEMSESIQDMSKRLKEKKVIQEPTVNEPEKL